MLWLKHQRTTDRNSDSPSLCTSHLEPPHETHSSQHRSGDSLPQSAAAVPWLASKHLCRAPSKTPLRSLSQQLMSASRLSPDSAPRDFEGGFSTELCIGVLEQA